MAYAARNPYDEPSTIDVAPSIARKKLVAGNSALAAIDPVSIDKTTVPIDSATVPIDKSGVSIQPLAAGTIAASPATALLRPYAPPGGVWNTLTQPRSALNVLKGATTAAIRAAPSIGGGAMAVGRGLVSAATAPVAMIPAGAGMLASKMAGGDLSTGLDPAMLARAVGEGYANVAPEWAGGLPASTVAAGREMGASNIGSGRMSLNPWAEGEGNWYGAPEAAPGIGKPPVRTVAAPVTAAPVAPVAPPDSAVVPPAVAPTPAAAPPAVIPRLQQPPAIVAPVKEPLGPMPSLQGGDNIFASMLQLGQDQAAYRDKAGRNAITQSDFTNRSKAFQDNLAATSDIARANVGIGTENRANLAQASGIAHTQAQAELYKQQAESAKQVEADRQELRSLGKQMNAEQDPEKRRRIQDQMYAVQGKPLEKPTIIHPSIINYDEMGKPIYSKPMEYDPHTRQTRVLEALATPNAPLKEGATGMGKDPKTGKMVPVVVKNGVWVSK